MRGAGTNNYTTDHRDRAQELAAKGFNSKQIARELGLIYSDGFRKQLGRWGINTKRGGFYERGNGTQVPVERVSGTEQSEN